VLADISETHSNIAVLRSIFESGGLCTLLDPDEHEHLHALAGTAPDAPDLAALIGCPAQKPDFARLWERYNVTRRTAAQNKTFHHPHVGTITLGFQ
jgi:hypothetical protein